MHKMKKLCHVVVKLFYFMHFFPMLHIWPPGVKTDILTIFVPILAILEHFMTEKGKNA